LSTCDTDYVERVYLVLPFGEKTCLLLRSVAIPLH